MAELPFGGAPTFDFTTNQDFQIYLQRLEQWMLVHDSGGNDKAKVKKRALLLSTLSEATYKLAIDLALPNKLEELEYEKN